MKKILLYEDYGASTSDELFKWLKKHLSHNYEIQKTDATSIIKLNHLKDDVFDY